MNNNKFRADLYYRLNEFHIDLPPLRARTGDLEHLVEHFIQDANAELNKSVSSVSDEVMKKIKAHTWPGNVRELRNTIRRAVLLTPGIVMEKISITDDVAPKTIYEPVNDDNDSTTFETLTKKAEKDAILSALDESGGNKSKAAKLLNMNERTFYRKLKNLGIS